MYINKLLIRLILFCVALSTTAQTIAATAEGTYRRQWYVDKVLEQDKKDAAEALRNKIPAEPEKLLPGEIGMGYFVKLPGVKDVQISNDGKHLSVVHREKGEDKLAIVDAISLKTLGVYEVWGAGQSVGKVYWVNNERLLYSVTANLAWDKQRLENGDLFALNVDGTQHKAVFGDRSKKRNLINDPKMGMAQFGNHQIIDLLKDDPKHILIAFYPWRISGHVWRLSDKQKPILYQLNVYSGKRRRVGLLPLAKASGITDNNGEVRFATAINEQNQLEVSYKNVDSNQWERWLPTGFEGNNPRPLSFAQDNNSVYLLANAGTGTQALYLFDLKLKTTKKLVHNPLVDISQLMWDFSGRRVVGVGTELGLPHYQYIDVTNKKAVLHQQLLKTFKNASVQITSATTDASKVIAFVYSDVNPGEYYLFDTVQNNAQKLISKRNWIDPNTMANKTPLTIKSRDGVLLHAYLTKPPVFNKTSKAGINRLPMVVLPHGGPHGVRDHWGFDWQVQLLANRGYAVLQVNYRGSNGFGLAFEHSGRGKWGTVMQDDLTDATHLMIKNGVADKNRICMFGTSYGGYAALMGAVREPELYRCVIGSAGVYNLPMLFEKGDMADRKNGLAYLKTVLGENTQDLKRRSPVYHASKIKAQVLLIHGAHDKRAPMAQADSLKAALDAIGKPYQWLELSDEAHSYFDETNRLLVYKTVLEFLQKHIGLPVSE